MLNRRHPFRWPFAVALALCGAVRAGGFEDAQRILASTEPMACDIMAAEKRISRADPRSKEFRDHLAERDRALASLQKQMEASWPDYVAVLNRLSEQEKEAVDLYSKQITQRCDLRDCGVSPCVAKEAEGPRKRALREPPPGPKVKAPHVPPGQTDGSGTPSRDTRVQRQGP